MLPSLRNSVQQKYGSPVNAPRDCNRLSELIEDSTGRSISQTSLRRFFGLLHSNSALSRYNLDTLAIYCGYRDYEKFVKTGASEPTGHKPAEGDIISGLIAEMDHLSGYTLKSISRMCLTSFEHTIPRQEVNDKLSQFIRSPYSIFPLIAPGGYGKSITLAHWYLSVKKAFHCLFTPAAIFHNMFARKGSTTWNIELNPGRPGNLYESLLNGIVTSDRPLVLILDSVDEISAGKDQLFEFIDYLFDVANTYIGGGSLKIVFALRESAWNDYLSNRFERFEATSWFEREAPLLETGYTNLGLLTNGEIRTIVEQSNQSNQSEKSPHPPLSNQSANSVHATHSTPSAKSPQPPHPTSANQIQSNLTNPSTKCPFIFECLPWDLRELARVPINLHFISEVFRRKGSIADIAHVDITRAYVKEFVFKAQYAEEKEDIIREVLGLMDHSGDYTGVLKNDLKRACPVHLKREKAYYQAYRDLLSSGVFIERREENTYGVYTTKIAFRHHNFFIYLYALYLIGENGGLDFRLINSIAHLRKHELWIPHLVAILYEIAYESEELDAISRFCELPVKLLEALPVRIAVGTSFRRENSIRNQLIRLFAASPAGRTCFFEQYVDVNYLFNNYRFRITEYLKHAPEGEPQLFANCILYQAGFLKMDRHAARRYHAVLERIEPDEHYYPWPIGRKVGAHIVHAGFVEKQEVGDLPGMIERYAAIAHSYPGYLGRSLVEFELYILVALALVQEYEILESVAMGCVEKYGLSLKPTVKESVVRKTQNSIPFYFLEYAKFKLGRSEHSNLTAYYETAISNYTTTFDDFQYLIWLNLFLYEIYSADRHFDRARDAYDRALELSRMAAYDLYTAILLNNDPYNDPENRERAAGMIDASGFNPALFSLSFGPALAQ
jgi:hypothetical protein